MDTMVLLPMNAQNSVMSLFYSISKLKLSNANIRFFPHLKERIILCSLAVFRNNDIFEMFTNF